MQLDYNQLVPLILSVLATVISAAAYIRSRKHLERTLRTEKIELIYEYIENLTSIYHELFDINKAMDLYQNESDIKLIRDVHLRDYKQKSDKFRNIHDVKELYTTIIKAEILSRSYLCNNSCLKVVAFLQMIKEIAEYSLGFQYIKKRIYWNNGFPEPRKVDKYADDLANLLIEEIRFVKGQKEFSKKLRDFINGPFKSYFK